MGESSCSLKKTAPSPPKPFLCHLQFSDALSPQKFSAISEKTSMEIFGKYKVLAAVSVCVVVWTGPEITGSNSKKALSLRYLACQSRAMLTRTRTKKCLYSLLKGWFLLIIHFNLKCEFLKHSIRVWFFGTLLNVCSTSSALPQLCVPSHASILLICSLDLFSYPMLQGEAACWMFALLVIPVLEALIKLLNSLLRELSTFNSFF